ncbi:MAG: ribonuclease HIII [Cyanobacteria bacterium]|nr:ribonuclease HIII [Cyanobacteriota bacterium]
MQNVLAPLSGKNNIPASSITTSTLKPSRNISTSEAITRDPLTGKSTGKVNLAGSYIGTDESGKGDYFGPLVIAGVFVNEDTCAALLKAGVMDSKKLTDRQIMGLAQAIHQIVGQEGICVVEMGPAKYNQLYDSFKQKGKNLNHLLAWGHARAIENLLTNNPSCTQAIADQFGSEHYIKSMLQEKGKQITLHQTPRAEANIGVAAASVIARYRFVQRLQKLSEQFQITLPLGAGSQVPITAKKFIQTHGKDKLGEVAKLHFKTTLAL